MYEPDANVYMYFRRAIFKELAKTSPHPGSNTFTSVLLNFYLLKFSTKAVCGAKTRLKPGAYDSSEGLPNSGLHIEGINVAINATATPVRLARINWAIGGIFRDFRFQDNENLSRLQSSQSCVTTSAIFVFAFWRETCSLLYVLVSDWSRNNANKIERAREKEKTCLGT